MESLTVRILDRDYRLACEPAERDTLLAAAAHVDARMQAIRDQGKVVGVERIAVFAALNIAGALLSQPAANGHDAAATEAASIPAEPSAAPVADADILRRMQDIDALLDTALANQERLF